jgi:hypothetical protein
MFFQLLHCFIIAFLYDRLILSACSVFGVEHSVWSPIKPLAFGTLQIILVLSVPEKELAKTRSQISFIYFRSHS